MQVSEYLIWIVKHLNNFTLFLHQFLNIYIIIFLYAIVYFSIVSIVGYFFKKELIKRKEIIHDTHLYKVTHPFITTENSEETMKTIFHQKHSYPESYYTSLHQIVERYNPHPFRIIMLFSGQYLILAALVMSLYSVDTLKHTFYMFPLAVLLFFLSYFQKNRWLLRLLALTFIIIVYSKFPDEILWLFTFTNLFKIIKKPIKKFLVKRKETS